MGRQNSQAVKVFFLMKVFLELCRRFCGVYSFFSAGGRGKTELFGVILEESLLFFLGAFWALGLHLDFVESTHELQL